MSLVTEFSKKTGDYPSLSATDIKVLALTYQLELEHVGSQHLKTEVDIKVPAWFFCQIWVLTGSYLSAELGFPQRHENVFFFR